MKKFVSLLSGGLDSPIAAYLMMKKNFSPVFLSFLTSDDEENSMKKKVVRIVQKLAQHTKEKVKLYFINHDHNLERFKRKCERKLTCILCKRLMIRIAKGIGKIENTNIIVTGDILGEQASQTLDNLYAYNDLLEEFFLLRPLIGRDKLEIIKINEKIGLYEITSQGSAGCQYNPQFPETHAKPNEIKGEELLINYDDLIKKSIEKAEILFF
ncbi:MAG: hypothetical protein EU540_02765 [Promethearchaeota archaeon]|nr:MAG: hypothetical protein EU540_02765 [Candidatus Lokiarchaeota archaeon]